MQKLILMALLLGISTLAKAESKVSSIRMPNTYSYSSKRPKDKPFLNGQFKNAQCIGCDYLGEIEVTPGHEKDFNICTNRKMYDGRSILKNCPAGTFNELMGNSNFVRCISCHEEFSVLSTQKECAKCSNRMWQKARTMSDMDMGSCELKKRK